MFEARSYNGKELSDRHALLCSQVLDIYSSIGRTIGNELSEETWEVFLKILIGISDSILRKDAPANVEALQRRLCSQLQKVLFELWLLSKTKNPLLWEALQQRVRGWTKHMPLILAWKVVSFALTKRTVNILYGGSEGGTTAASDTVVVKFDDSVQHLQLDDQYVFYAWHRILNLIGNPNETIDQPQNLLAFMSGVELVVNQFLKITFALEKSTSTLIAPTGNTILHIFGSWLFDCVLLNRSGFEEGTALAMKILSNIMITTHKTNFLPIYISSYFSCVQRALNTEGRVLVSVITSSSNIFIKDIKGIRCLVPLFFNAIQKVLSGKIKSIENVMPAEHFRKACLQIFSTIICLPNHLTSTTFTTKLFPSNELKITDYSSLKPHYSSLLTEALTKETNKSNTEFLLNLSYIWVVEDIDNNCDFARQIIGLIIRKVTQNRWTPDVIIPAFNILTSLAHLYPKIDKGYEQANLVVDQLCRIIINIGNPPTPGMESISVLAFRCISHWIMTDQWLFNFKETRNALLTAIVTALTGKSSTTQNPELDSTNVVNIPQASSSSSSSKKKDKKSKKEEKLKSKEEQQAIKASEISKNQPEVSFEIKEAAQTTLMTILNHLGNFPTTSGASVISTLAFEDEILQEIINSSSETITKDQTKEFMRYFITDDRVILCVIDRPYHPKGPHTCIIIRDKTGRYAWDANLTYSSVNSNTNSDDGNGGSSPSGGTIYHETEIPITGIPFQASSIKPMDVNELSNVLGYLSSCSTSEAFKKVEQQVQKEFKVLKRSNFKLAADISTKIPQQADTYAADCKFQQSRMFLSHVGYLSLENRAKFSPLNMNSSFYEALRQLDEKSERISINVGVLYGRKNQDESEWYGNLGGSLDYQEFISTLGWGIHIDKHNGHKGTLDSYGGELAPYWANYSTEVLFQVTTLVPNREEYPDHSHKRKIALDCTTLIIWLEDFGSFQAQWIWKHVRYNIIIIVIVPLEFGLYSVRIFSKDDLYCIGPVCDACVLSKTVLGNVIRDTCVLSYYKENNDKPSPTQARIECIDRIFELFKKNCNLEQFYTNQFTTLDSDQISPLQLDRVRSIRKFASIKSLPGSIAIPKDMKKQKKSSSSKKSKKSSDPTLKPKESSVTISDRPISPKKKIPPPVAPRRDPPPPQGKRPPPSRPQVSAPTDPPPGSELSKSGSWVGGSKVTARPQKSGNRPRPPKLFGTQRRSHPTDESGS